MIYCVGLTGTMGSGKSTAASYFSSQHISVLSADQFARELTQPGTDAYAEIKQHFGEAICLKQGPIDRAALRRCISTDENARRWLEVCLHPRIRQAIECAIHKTTSPYCIIEIPLLTNRAHYPYLNRVLLIQSTQDKQIQRIMARDLCSRQSAEALLKTQAHSDVYLSIADDVIQNTTTLDEFTIKLAQQHQYYLSLVSKHRH